MHDVSVLGVKITSNGIIKTTGELDKFSAAMKRAAQANKPISIKVSSSTAKTLADIKAMDKALSNLRASSRSGIGVRITTAGNAKAISDIAKMGASLREARASARNPINVRVTSTGVNETISQLQRLITELRRARTEGGRGGGGAPRGGGSDIGAPTSGDISAVRGMTGAVMGLVSAYSLLQGAKIYASLTDESKMLTAQLKLATSESGNFLQAQKDVRAIAVETRGDLSTTATLYGKLMLNSRQLGISQEEAARATETVTKAFKVSGSGAVETAQGTRQLVQALQSGVLRGDEFNTMAEAAPRLQKLLADSLGVSQGQLRKMAEEGELTSDKLTKAFTDKEFTAALDAEFAKLPVTFDDAMGQIYNAAVITFGAFDEGGEFSKAILNFVIGGTKGFADMETAARNAGVAFRGEINGLTSALGPAITEMGALLGVFTDLKNQVGDGMFSQLFRDLDAIDAWASRNTPSWMKSASFSERYDAGRREASGRDLSKTINDKARDAFERKREEESTTRVTAATTKDTKAKKDRASAAENLAKRLEKERQATEALISGLYEAAAGYYESAAAGKKAEVEAEAVAKGMKKGGDAAAYTAQQLRKYVAEQVASSAESVRATLDQISAQRDINDRIEAGTLSIDDASTALADLNSQRSLTIALDIAKTLKDDGVAAKAAQSSLDAHTKAQKQFNDEQRRRVDLEKENQILNNTGDMERETEELRKLGEARIKAMRGLSGDALEDELRRLAQAYELTALAAEYDRKIADANAASHYKAAAAYVAEYEARKKQITQGQSQGNAEDDMRRNRDYAINAAHDIADIIGGGIGDAANALIDVLAEMSSVFNALGPLFANLSKNMKLGGAFGNLTGSSSGGAIGGGVGGALGKEFLTKGLESVMKGLGKFAGPLGAIAGGLIGGLIGGMLKKTPKASATISVIAGQAMETAITGNKDKLKKAAGQMADSVLSGLTDLASALGAELTGNASVSIGMRKGNYRVDPTGAGRTKGAGVIDFGEDQAAAMAYAMQDAIKDGVLSGLGESLNRLIQGDGDLQKQLEKALSFKGVFDELLQLTDPQAFDLAALDKWRTSMDKIFAEAGATAEEIAKLEELAGIKRTEIVDKYAKEAEEKARQSREIEIQIMELQGREIEALAAARELEYAEMDEGTRALADARDALSDWIAQVEKARNIFSQQTSLDQELLTLQAQMTTGDESARLNALALKLAREDELRSADAVLRPLLLLKYEYQDQVTEIEKLREAEAALAESRKADADEIAGLTRQWLEVIGDKDAIRALDLAALRTDDARTLQQKIWDYQDAQAQAAIETEKAAAAQEAYAQSLSNARDTLIEAYERESGALQGTVDKFRSFASAIRDFRNGLFLSDDPGVAFAQAQGQFQSTSRMANLGSENALGAFVGDAQAYIDAAKANAGSLAEYQAVVAEVAMASSRAAGGANGVANAAQKQIDLMKSQVDGIIVLNEGFVSFTDALATYTEIQAQGVPMVVDTVTAGLVGVVDTLNANATQSETKNDELAFVLGQVRDYLERVDRNVNNVTRGGTYVAVGGDIDGDAPAVRVIEVTP